MLNLKYWVFIKNSVKIGCNIPLLPKLVNRIYNYFLVRIIRVLGGISLIIYIIEYHNYFGVVVIYFAVIHLIQVIIISIIKIIYSIFVFHSIGFELSQSIVCVTILLRVLLIIIMECVGFLGFDVLQYIEIYTHISDMKNCIKNMFIDEKNKIKESFRNKRFIMFKLFRFIFFIIKKS